MKTLTHGTTVVNLRSYTIWPKRGNGDADFTVKVNGVEFPISDVRKTGGGIHPIYTYLKIDGKTFFANIDLPKGAEITVADKTVEAKPEAAKVEAPKVEAPTVEAPKLTKKQRRAAEAAAKLAAAAK